jgi:amino acid adenylation domain-containing protein
MKEVEISQIQKQFWILQNVYRNNTTYNIPSVLKISGLPDLNALDYAFNQIIERHEVLRVYFDEKNNEVYQKSLNLDQLKIKVDIVEMHEPLQENKLPDQIMEEVHKVFRLGEWPLLRVKLFSFSDRLSVLTIVFHHILVDLNSKRIFAEEFSQLYNSYCGKFTSNLKKITSQYSEYSMWEKTWLQSEESQKMLHEWKKYIPLTPDILEIAADYPKPRVQDLEGKRKHFTIDKDLSFRILRFAQENSVSTFAVLLTAYAILLNRLTNQSSIIIGVPLTNRRKPEFKDTFGCFVNIVPVLVNFDEQITGLELLKQIRHSLLTAHRIQEIPFILINNLLKTQDNNSILQAGFTFEPLMNLTLNNLDIQPLVVEKLGSQLDLFITFWEQEEGFNGYLEYSTLLFKENTAKRFINIYQQIIKSYLQHPGLPTSDLDIASEEETRLISEWNNTDHEYTGNICLHQKFEQQVLKMPDSTALFFGDSSISYSELNLHINRLANYLIESGVKIEDIICVCMERSFEIMIGIYGIHKAGAAYLPVDPNYPSERLEMILSDANPRFVLTNKRSEKNIPVNYKRIYIDNITTTPLSKNDKTPETKVNSRNLAYVIYTSGSTGKPKGVMIEHHSVINKLEWMQFQHHLTSEDVLMLKTPVTFDVSVWELFWWMFNGSKLAILPPEGEKMPKTIIEEVESRKVTTIVFVPSMFSSFVAYIKANRASGRLISLKWIIQIGEALSPQLVNNFNELRTPDFNPLIVNTYGPTEATVAVSWYDCPQENNIEKIYIGKPIFNTKLVVLNSRNKIQPIGVPGELVITGVNLSRGYLNRPELNTEKFIQFKYLNGHTLRGYKTGDIVKLLDDGNIDFIGRDDNQVKIRGYRIELGDIESKLLDFPEIKSAAVIVNKSNPENQIIVGYIVLNVADSSSSEEIRQFLTARLPDYMVPAQIVILDALPLGTSGKIDRKSLPDPDFICKKKIVEPVSNYEKKLQQIWKESLKFENIGITHNFFDLGGNSLLAIHIVAKIKDVLNLSIEPIHIMEFPTIRGLARFIAEYYIEGTNSKATQKMEKKDVRKRDFSRLQNKRR